MLDLRHLLSLDAAASGLLGVLLVLLFAPAEDQLGIPVALSVTTGALLLVWAGVVVWVARGPSRGRVRGVIGLNLLYVAASVTFALADPVDLTGLGVAFVLVQAVAVLGLAAGQLATTTVGV
ncbi:hypothetical protein [Nocardioides sp.]|uniref:hypothetical protein n=1 Tax=Nocardioides sp. TaxID=35761 RepID=UPI001A235100|nr:hypothetical protein [Nocardioides sp.]MBJ7357808.1 hypothetical protein [Nocardioides sp.]